MKLKAIEEYIEGTKFSNGLKIDCFTENKIINRLDFLIEKAKNKNVLHIGFTDHLPLIETKIKQNKWLHKRLVEVCQICIGVDINKSAIEFISSNFGIENIYYHDIIKDEPLETIKNIKIDYIILADVLEHIDNPVEFLQTINKKYSGIADKIIITVPNAFDFENIKQLKKNTEFINTDHRYWFTPFTIAKVAGQAGLRSIDQGFCNPPTHQFRLVRKFIKKYPIMSETIYLIAELDGRK